MKNTLLKIIFLTIAIDVSIASVGYLVTHEIESIKMKPKAILVKGKLPTKLSWDRITLNGIQHFESFAETPYVCPAGVLTIGYGFTEKKLVDRGRITKNEAKRILSNQLTNQCTLVKKYVKVKLTEHQLYALASFTFNCGEGSLKQLVNGKDRLNSGNYKSVPDLMMKYKFANGKPLRGLELRRAWEAKIWKAV